MTISGHFYTSDASAASHLRYAFYDWLDSPSFNISDFSREVGVQGDEWHEYSLNVTDAPTWLYEKFRELYVGSEAIYPYCVGVCAYLKPDVLESP